MVLLSTPVVLLTAAVAVQARGIEHPTNVRRQWSWPWSSSSSDDDAPAPRETPRPKWPWSSSSQSAPGAPTVPKWPFGAASSSPKGSSPSSQGSSGSQGVAPYGSQTGPVGPVNSPPVSGPQIGKPMWKPQIGQKLQVILASRVARLDRSAPLIPEQADIWDLDLFDTTKDTIDILHSRGKRVICYLSVGGSESWRSDYRSIPRSDLGDEMPKWKGERYLNMRSPTVWKLMQSRIKMAYDKGCDALDPDNVDPFNDDFQRGGGFKPPLTEKDSVDYLRKISDEAQRYGMSMGMKNAESILPNVTSFIQFAVNEECTTYSDALDGCNLYEPFVRSGKPVFHFEYVTVDNSARFPAIQSIYPNWKNLTSPQILNYYCLKNTYGWPNLPNPQVGALFSTTIKKLDLGGWVMWCDGSWADTPTAQSPGGPEAEQDSGRRGAKGGRNADRRSMKFGALN